jgi:hypothetical protein
MGGSGEDTVKPYPVVGDLVEPAVRVRMPRVPRVVAPGGTIHVVARCNNREFYFTTAEDCDCLLAHLRELIRTYEVTVYAYTLLSNHVHLLMQAPTHEALGRPLRSVDISTGKTSKAAIERSDICAVPAASVIARAAVAIELASAMLEKFGGDSMPELKRNFSGYLDSLREMP